MLQRRYARRAARQDNVWRERDQFCRIFARAVDIILAPAGVDANITAIAPAQVFHSLLERYEAGSAVRIVRGSVHEHADESQLLRLLRARSEPPRRRHTENLDELAPPHVRHRASSSLGAAGQSTARSTCRRGAGKSLGRTCCSESRRCRHTTRQEAAALRDY